MRITIVDMSFKESKPVFEAKILKVKAIKNDLLCSRGSNIYNIKEINCLKKTCGKQVLISFENKENAIKIAKHFFELRRNWLRKSMEKIVKSRTMKGLL